MAQDTGISPAELRRLASRARELALRAVQRAQAGHIGGPLSVMDILTVLYFRVLRIDPARPRWPERDRLILSKGHSAVGLYAVLALRGYFPEDELATFDAARSRLQGHPDMTALPGLDMSTGSLGQGLSVGLGMVLAARAQGLAFRAYVVLGDGELQEGQVWEAADVAAKYRAGALTAILDWNRLQQFGWEENGRRLPPVANPGERFRSFGWRVLECDGHDHGAIAAACAAAAAHEGGPTLIVARTVKGKGVSFMEDRHEWHSKPLSAEELEAAARELREAAGP